MNYNTERVQTTQYPHPYAWRCMISTLSVLLSESGFRSAENDCQQDVLVFELMKNRNNRNWNRKSFF